MPMSSVAAVIVAAGSSERLGRPKQLVMLDGETLLGRAIRFAQEAGAAPVLVVLGAHREEIEAQVDFAKSEIIVNQKWQEGIASSICAGISAVEEQNLMVSGVLLMVCDQPCVTTKHLGRMLDAFSKDATSAVASVYLSMRGIPAVFPREAFEELLALRGDKGARGLLADPRRKVTEIALGGGEFDIDEPRDLDRMKGPLNRMKY